MWSVKVGVWEPSQRTPGERTFLLCVAERIPFCGGHRGLICCPWTPASPPPPLTSVVEVQGLHEMTTTQQQLPVAVVVLGVVGGLDPLCVCGLRGEGAGGVWGRSGLTDETQPPLVLQQHADGGAVVLQRAAGRPRLHLGGVADGRLQLCGAVLHGEGRWGLEQGQTVLHPPVLLGALHAGQPLLALPAEAPPFVLVALAFFFPAEAEGVRVGPGRGRIRLGGRLPGLLVPSRDTAPTPSAPTGA